jgi:transcriptional regulator with XRE-family HTH domain
MGKTNEMLRLLDRIGWSQAEFSRRAGVHVNTVTNWAKTEAPKLALEFLRLRAKLKELSE